MFNTINTLVLALLLFSMNTKAMVYKCVDPQGTIHYQSFECEIDDQEKVMEKIPVGGDVVLYKTEHNKAQQHQLDDALKLENQQFKDMTDSEINQCLSYLKKYDQIVELIKARCVRNREDNCDLPAEQIEKLRHQKELSRSNPDQVQSSHEKSYTPPILQMKEKLNTMNCL
jgi:hypothetical protein